MVKHRISNLTQKLRAAAAILMVSSLGLFYPGVVSNLHAQSPTKATPSSPAGGPKEGIKVHGNWTIEVRNPDGKLVERREFKNALKDAGVFTLGKLLRRESRLGEWMISLYASNAFLAQATCQIYEVNSQVTPSNNLSTTLTISQEGNTDNTVLTGTATAAENGVIASVRTFVKRCPVEGSCANQPYWEFTATSLPNAINVVTGQIIQVKVVISFS